MDLGLTYYSMHVDYKDGEFLFTLHFALKATGGMYSINGAAATPEQCVEQATGFIARVVREAVAP